MHGHDPLGPSPTAPVVELQLMGKAAAAEAAERGSSSEAAAFAEYAGSIIDECSRRVLAAAQEGGTPEDGDGGGGQGGGDSGQGGGRGSGQGARVALRAGAWLHDEPVAALLPSLLLSMAGAPSPPPAAVLPALRRFVEAALASGLLGGGGSGGDTGGDTGDAAEMTRDAAGDMAGGAGDAGDAAGGAAGDAGGAAEMAHEAHAFMYSTARAGDAPRAARLTVPPSGDPTGEHGRSPSDDAGAAGSSGEAVAAVAAASSAGSTAGASAQVSGGERTGMPAHWSARTGPVWVEAEPMTTHQERLAAAMVAAAASAIAQLPEFLSGNSALQLEGNSLSSSLLEP